jgi:hypothetical protein
MRWLQAVQIALGQNLRQFVLIDCFFPKLIHTRDAGLHAEAHFKGSHSRGSGDVLVIYLKEIFPARLGFE